MLYTCIITLQYDTALAQIKVSFSFFLYTAIALLSDKVTLVETYPGFRQLESQWHML